MTNKIDEVKRKENEKKIEYYFYTIKYILYSMLEKLFTSKTRVKLLTMFLLNPETDMYVI